MRSGDVRFGVLFRSWWSFNRCRTPYQRTQNVVGRSIAVLRPAPAAAAEEPVARRERARRERRERSSEVLRRVRTSEIVRTRAGIHVTGSLD